MTPSTRPVTIGLLSVLLTVGAVRSPAAQGTDPSTFLDLSVFARGSSGNLVMYHQTAAGWETANLSHNLGTSFRIVGDPSVVSSFRREVGGRYYYRPQVFGRNAEGKLLDFHWTFGSGWRARNRTNEAGGGRFTGNPVAVVSTAYDQPWTVIHVFGRGRVLQNDGTWLENRLVHYWWADGLPWDAEDLTDIPNAPEILSDPDVVLTGEYNSVRLDVFARSHGSQLVRYWWTPQAGWNRQGWNLTALAVGGVSITGGFDAVSGADDGPAPWRATRLDVFARNASFQLVRYSSTDWNSWTCENVSGPIGGVMFGRPDVVVSSEDGTLRHDVIARSDHDRLLRYVWTAASGWRPFYVWAPTVAADPVLFRYFRHGVDAFDVFARATSSSTAGDLLHFWQGPDPTSGIGLENLTSTTAGTPIAGQPNAVRNYTTLEVFARSAEGHLLRYWYDPRQVAWQSRDLTSDWAGPTVFGHPVLLMGLNWQAE
jgi:hypothetical protein